MQQPPQPDNEALRQRALMSSGLLDSLAEERFDRMTRLAQRLFQVPIALISLVDAQRQWFKSSQGLDVTETPRSLSFCGYAILSDRVLVIENALNDERFADNPLVTGPPHIRFYAGAPLNFAGHRIGTLCVIDDKPRIFSAQDQSALRDMANTVEALIIGSARERPDLGLVSDLAFAHRMMEGMREGFSVISPDGVQQKVNPAFCAMTGFSADELLGQRPPYPYWPEDQYAAIEQALSTTVSVGSGQFELIFKKKNGERFPVVLSVSSLKDEHGEPVCFFANIRDVSAEVEAQQALKASRDQYASLVAHIPGVTYRCLPDEHWTMLFISKQVASISGYSTEELLENARISYARLIHPDDADRVERVVQQAITGWQSWHVEYRIRHKQGDWRWVEERGRPVAGNADQPVLLEGFLVDVTRDKQAREQLNRNHDALFVLNRIACHATTDLNAKIGFALDQAREFLRMDAAIVSQIEGEVYSVRWLSAPQGSGLEPGQHFSLGDTWCRVLLNGLDDELLLPNATGADYRGHPCYSKFPVGSYMGLVIEVENRLFGTLNFTAQTARSSDFDESEALFARLLAQWLVNTLDANLSNLRLDKLMAQLPGTLYQFRRFPDGRTVFPFSSPGIRTLYGISPQQAAEDATAAFERIHPDDLPVIVQSIEVSADTLENWHAAYRVRTDQGQYRWVAGEARPERLADGSVLWHGFIQDIDAQEQVRLAMERSEQRLRSLFEFSPIGIALNDLETGQFIDLNPALLAPTGYTREEFVNLSYWDVTPKEYESEEIKALEGLKSEGRYGPFEKEYIRKDGSRYPVRLQGMLTQDADGRALIWLLIEDISERRRLERMKGQFIATVSHELRTPLTSISGSLGLLAGGAAGSLPQKAESLVATALRNAQRLSSLINDLLDMEKLVAGKMSIKALEQPVLPVVREAIESMRDYASRHQVVLQLVNPLSDVHALVDAERLIQAINNLLSNAVKYSPEGDVVTLAMAIDNNRLQLSVQDRGPGVDPTFKDQLFKRFSQADSSDTRKLPGTGLGLAITREIIHQLGGEVSYEDAPGGGSRFQICLPITEDRPK